MIYADNVAPGLYHHGHVVGVKNESIELSHNPEASFFNRRLEFLMNHDSPFYMRSGGCVRSYDVIYNHYDSLEPKLIYNEAVWSNLSPRDVSLIGVDGLVVSSALGLLVDYDILAEMIV